MKRAISASISCLPIMLWAGATLWNLFRGTPNNGLHMLPINATEELIQISHGQVGQFPGWWASAFFGGIGVVIFVAWIVSAIWSVKAASPIGAVVTTFIFCAVTAAWSLFIIIPRSVVPTG
jgi:hypothetical protein